MSRGRTPPKMAGKQLDELLAKTEGFCTSLKNMEISDSSDDAGVFQIKRWAAEDISLAVADYVQTLITSARFREYAKEHPKKVQDYIFKHVLGNDIGADALEQDIRTMVRNYGQGDLNQWMPGETTTFFDDPSYIFVIVIEALRPDHLGYNGYSRNTTPFLDKLAGEGLVFENAFAQAPVTNISVSSLLTAMYPNTHKMTSGSDWLYELNLVDVFRAEGYETGAFSGNSLVSPRWNYNFGFDHFALHDMCRGAVLINETTRWLEKTTMRSNRIFAYIHLFEPHDIYMAPEPYFNKFDSGHAFRFPAGALKFQLYHSDDKCGFDPMNENWDRPETVFECLKQSDYLPPDVNPDDVSNMIDRYDGEILYADTEIERFFEYLDEKGILKDSLVVILSDHGESFMEHNQFLHSAVLYDHEIHVPLMLWRGTGNWGGKRDSRLVELVDVFPAIFNLHGIAPPEFVHGRDMLSNEYHKDFVFSMTTFYPHDGGTEHIISARSKDYKFIYRFFDESTELYDLASDPGEMKNICGSHENICLNMKTEAVSWNEETDIESFRDLQDSKDIDLKNKMKDLGYIK